MPALNKHGTVSPGYSGGLRAIRPTVGGATGRFPANLCHDGSQEVLDLFPETKGDTGRSLAGGAFGKQGIYGRAAGAATASYNEVAGSAARFFYHAKASKHDRCGSRHPTVKPESSSCNGSAAW